MSVSRRIKLFFTIIALLGLTVFYPFIVYSTNALVTELRTLWISTAMETMTHQWLATAFFPKDMVTDVVEARKQMFESQKDIQSVWKEEELPVVQEPEKPLTEKEKFYQMFDELDQESAETFFAEHPRYIENGYENINLDWCEKKEDTGIVTKQGDKVVAINAQKDLAIVELTRKSALGEYTGYLAIVKDPSRVELGLCKGMGKRAGQRMPDLAEYNGAILGINASGFIDNGEAAEGGTPYGYVKKDGEKLQGAFGHGYKIIGFDEEHRFLIGDTTTAEKMVDAVEFGPAFIVNGKKMDELDKIGSLQPRTAIGQREDKSVLMLVVDGRYQGGSTGCRGVDCRDILWDYGAVQACNLDGGSSSVMYYQGRVINSPTTSTGNRDGRRLPNGFMVK